MTTSMPTVINGSIIITTMKSNRDNASTLHVNHFEDHEVNSTITTSNSSLVIILTATIIPVILVLVLLSTVMILVITWNLGKYEKHKILILSLALLCSIQSRSQK